MSQHSTLLQTALMGSERPWAPAADQPANPVTQLLRDAHAAAPPDAPGLLLRLAGAEAICRQAGWMAPVAQQPPMAPAAPETRSAAHEAWGQLLTQAFAQGPLRLQHQVLQALDHAALHVPPALLPTLLHAGRQNAALRAHLLPVLGERGRWLATLNSEWAYACGAEEQASTETQWAHGSLQQRCAVLQAERATNATAARERLQADWGNLAAKDRAALIDTLQQGLCADDEAFLNAQLKDRAQDVRHIAADLLATLPGSAYSQRMVARMLPLVECGHPEKGLVGRMLERVRSSPSALRVSVEAPTQVDGDWKADLLETKRPTHEELGERAWWLYQLTRRTPLAWWTTHTGLSSADLLKAIKGSDWKDALLLGWHHAVLRQPDGEWALALLHHTPPGHRGGCTALLNLLTPEQREQFLLPQVDAGAALPTVISICLAGCAPHAHLGPAVSARLAQVLRQQIDRGVLTNGYVLRSQLPDLACALHPQSLSVLADVPRSAEETASLSECLGQLAHVLHSRSTLLQLTPSTQENPLP